MLQMWVDGQTFEIALKICVLSIFYSTDRQLLVTAIIFILTSYSLRYSHKLPICEVIF